MSAIADADHEPGSARGPRPDRSPPDGFVTARAAAAVLGVNERTVRRAIARGELPATKRGRGFQIAPEALVRYRARRRLPASLRTPGAAVSGRPAPLPASALADLPWPPAAALPTPLTRFIGREHDVASITRHLQRQDVRLVTLTGAGGVGKTRLALRVAEEIAAGFADGAAFVSLAETRDPVRALPTIARGLGVRESPGRSLSDALHIALQDRRLLLVLDSLEHLLNEAVVIGLTELLRTCPGLKALATSRAPLRMSGEHRFVVAPLALPEHDALDAARLLAYAAVALFVERAQQAQPGFTLDAGTAPIVLQICRRLDGLPLALELAAAQAPNLPLSALLHRLDRMLPLLTGGGLDQPARLRTMRDAIAWSYDLLSPQEQALFRRLGAFVGGFTVETAERVTGDGFRVSETLPSIEPLPPATRLPSPDTLSLLISLHEKSLIYLARPDDAEPRYALLETVREFALDALARRGEAAKSEAAHAALMLDLVEAAEPHLFGPDERRWVARIETELGNIRAVQAWALRHDPTTAQRIGAALWVYWAWSGHTAEGRQWLADALAASGATPPLVRAKALTVAAGLAFLQGDLPEGTGQIAEALTIARETGDPLTEARANYVAGGGLMAAGQPDAAIPFLDRSLVLFGTAETSTDRGWAAWTRVIRGMAAWQQGQTGEAIGFFEGALTEARAIGTQAETMLILNELAGGLSELGRTRLARAAVAEALTIGANFGELWPVGMMLHALASINAMEGAAFLAAERFGAAEALLNRAGMYFPPHYQARTARAFALLEAALGAQTFAEVLGGGRAAPGQVFAAALAEQEHAALRIDAGDAAGGGVPRLTPRERAVLRLLADGQSDRQIGEALFITRRTASKHVSSILAKLGVATRAGAVAAAIRGGLI